jgi:TolB-like protein
LIVVVGVRSQAQAPAPPISVAVLPFAAPEGTPDDARDAESLARDVATALSQWRWAAVVPPGSSSPAGDARSVGKALNVRYVANGDVRQVGDRKVVTVHLIDAATGASAWSDRLEFAAGSSLEPQSAPATRVSRRLRSALYDAEIRRASSNPIAGNAWDLVLRGDAFHHSIQRSRDRRARSNTNRRCASQLRAGSGVVVTNLNLTTNGLDLDPSSPGW